MQQVAATGSPTPSDWTMAMMSGDGSQAAAEAEMIPCFPDNVNPEFEQAVQLVPEFPHSEESLITEMYLEARTKHGHDHKQATMAILSQAANDEEAAKVMGVCNRLGLPTK